MSEVSCFMESFAMGLWCLMLLRDLGLAAAALVTGKGSASGNFTSLHQCKLSGCHWDGNAV